MINDHDPSENDNATCVTERLHRPDRNLGFDLKIARLTPSQQPKMTDNNPGHVIKESGSDITARSNSSSPQGWWVGGAFTVNTKDPTDAQISDVRKDKKSLIIIRTSVK